MTNWLQWSLLSAVFAALTAILAKVGVSEVDSNVATAIRTSVVLVFTWAIALMSHNTISLSRGMIPTSPRTWLYLSLSGVATGLSWLCYFRALQLGPASKVAPIDKLSVVLVILLAALFLGERFTVAKFVGGSLIALGCVILAVE
jgi:transporter family protein